LKATILFVDDEPAIREAASRLLRSAGYDVEVANDGRAALARYRERRRDLVLTDVMMPVMEGLEMIRELHKLDPDVRIIAMTGASAERADTYLSVAKDFGARAILRKPFNKSELIAAVKEVLGDVSEDQAD
jgi:CheY-like chemotaxis protein